jgi:hypothetical protein
MFTIQFIESSVSLQVQSTKSKLVKFRVFLHKFWEQRRSRPATDLPGMSQADRILSPLRSVVTYCRQKIIYGALCVCVRECVSFSLFRTPPCAFRKAAERLCERAFSYSGGGRFGKSGRIARRSLNRTPIAPAFSEGCAPLPGLSQKRGPLFAAPHE